MLRKVFFVFLFALVAMAQDLGLIAPPEAQAQILNRYEQMVAEAPSRLFSLNEVQRKHLLKLTSENSVASLSNIGLYDPPQNGSPRGEIGYCYGRAMAAHLIARKIGLAETSIKKIFAAGDMQNGSTRWRFHVATVVLGDDHEYYAIDPIIPGIIRKFNQENSTNLDPDRPLPLIQWIEMVRKKYDNTAAILERNPGLVDNPKFTGTVHFYLAESEAIMVDMREIPANIELETGERIIEILFDAIHKPGFEPVYATTRARTENRPDYFVISRAQALQDYFMVIHEPLDDQFNFFKLDATIFYLDANQLKTINRHYLYNGKQPASSEFQSYNLGYFPSLLRSISQMNESLL